MKKYFVLALVLVAFAVAPVFADITVGGEFRAGAMWEFDEEQYSGRLDRARLYLGADINDYNSFEGQLRADRFKERTDTRIKVDANGDPVLDANGDLQYEIKKTAFDDSSKDDNVRFYLYRFNVITDWAKYFGFDDMVGIKTKFGYDGVTTFDKLSYTIYDIGGSEPTLDRTLAGKINFDIMSIVKPYFGMTMRGFDDMQGKDVMELVVGTGIDFAPVWFEAYFGQNGEDDGGRMFGVEAEFSMDLQNDMALRVAGVLEMANDYGDDGDEWTYAFKVMAGFSAYGATIDAVFYGEEDAIGAVALSASYDVLDFFGIQAGTKFAFSDYKKDLAGDEAFLGCEFGIYVTPGKNMRYDLGYVIANEDVYDPGTGKHAYFSSGTAGIGGMNYKAGGLETMKGGLYFAANAKF